MSLIDTILGRPLASHEDRQQRIGAVAGIPTFGLDALSSEAYGPEAALTALLPLGAVGLTYILPITTAIIVLLGIVYVSYCQTIAAYPSGGGSYTVVFHGAPPQSLARSTPAPWLDARRISAVRWPRSLPSA
jgi:hypothetical protein